ncbi:MAG: hypothetical protein WEA75_12180 [Acidimicrobiia bacterium]
MDKRAGIIAGGVGAAILVIAGIAVAAGGGDDDPKVDTATEQTTTTLAPAPAPQSGGGSGGGGSGGSGSGSQNEQPYFQPDHSIEAYSEDNKPFVRVDLHAYDPDGPEEEEVYQVEFYWGDDQQTVIPGSDGSNNSFSATHEYDCSFGGQSVHVLVKAIDGEGGSAQFEGDVTLPSC